MQPITYYNNRISTLENNLQQALKKDKSLGWGRLVSSISIFPVVYFLWSAGWLYWLPIALLLLVVFIRFIIADINNKERISHLQYLIAVNHQELKAQQGDYFHYDDGNRFVPHNHAYANDIDVFGRASIFQYINRTTSEMGSSTLASWLLQPASVKEILQRQQAIKELAANTPWRQDLLAYGKAKKIESNTQQRLNSWLTEPTIFLSFKPWAILRYLLPVIIIGVMLLNLFDIVPNVVRTLSLLVFGAMAWVITKKVSPVQQQLSKIVDEVTVLKRSILLIENATFTSSFLQHLQQPFLINTNKASAELKKIQRILDQMDLRYNPLIFVPLDIFLLWDLQQILALEKWKNRNLQNIIQWLDALGKLEAISSLSSLHFNHPQWCMPTLEVTHFSIAGTEVGHPLINEVKRVNNYIDIDAAGKLMLITGSNMAGKSTYLRSIGTNVVLAMAGSAVCAKSFSLAPVQLITSMRIADNLEENTSTFYAELKKLKTVIEKVNSGEKVFILLDEILRGTNSLDRHTGSVALIKQLIKKHASGIIATHDVALAELTNTYPENILNYFFDVQVNNDELYFDYLLKEGVCTSLNASILMKKIGIEM
jgi:ABC-type lipoprotein export system ATPase subunit